jgi:L-galactose dehydrogenase
MFKYGILNNLRCFRKNQFRRCNRNLFSTTSSSVNEQILQLEKRVAQLEKMVESTKSAVKYRHLGSTNLRVSKLSLGCAPFGGVYGGMSQEVANNIILTCLRRGINFFDTSPYYGDYKSEIVLGKALRNAQETGEFQRSDYILATKCGRYVSGTDFSGATIEKSVIESMDRLQTDYIDIMQCHDIEFASSLHQVIQEAIPALEDAKNNNHINHIGITGLPLHVLDYVIEQVDGPASLANENRIIDTILTYCCYTLNNTQLTEFLPRWKHRGIGIIQGGATSMGLLTPNGPQDWHPAPDQVRDACYNAVKYCEKLGEDIVKLSFQYTFQENDISTCLVGVIDTNAMEENLIWMNEDINEETEELIKDIQNVLAPIRNRIWVESGSEENIALASSGFWSKNHSGEKIIQGNSTNLG